MTNIESIQGNTKISFVGWSFEKYNSERKAKNRLITKEEMLFLGVC